MGLVRTFFGLFRAVRTALLVLLLVASLSLNVASVALSGVASLMATAYGAVTGSKAVVTILKDEIVVKNNQIKGKNTKIASLEKSVATKDKKIASLTDDVAKLRASKHVTYRGQKKLLSEAVEDTTTRVGRRIAANAGRNIGSMFGEAIPFVGIGVIVAATTWEIKDSCDTMKDLHELDVAFNPSNAAQDGAQEVCGMAVPSKAEVGRMVKESPGKAWDKAKVSLPDLPDFPDLSLPIFGWPDIDWSFWN